MLDSTQTQQFATISQQDQGSSGAAATSLAVRTSGTQGTQVAATGKPAMLGKNNADEPLPTAKGEISETEWNDPVKLVGKLTQVSADTSATDAAHSNMRCGASNLLASTLLQKGRDGAADMLEKEAANAGNSLTQDEKEELKGIAGQLRSKAPQMRYDDLSMAQDYLYKIGNAGTHPGMKKGESIHTAQAGGLNATGIRYDDRGGHAVQQVLDGLVPGQSVLMAVSSDSSGTRLITSLQWASGLMGNHSSTTHTQRRAITPSPSEAQRDLSRSNLPVRSRNIRSARKILLRTSHPQRRQSFLQAPSSQLSCSLSQQKSRIDWGLLADFGWRCS